MHKNFPRMRLLAIACSAIFVASTAVAGPVLSWDYEVSSSFDTSAVEWHPGVGTTSAGLFELSWGRKDGAVGVNRSALQISNTPASGSVLTNGGAGEAIKYTHVNNDNLNTGSVYLTSATIDATLGLRPTGSGLDFSRFETSYTVLFAETNNTGFCPTTRTARGCNDIFVLIGDSNESFILDGYRYEVSFFASPGLKELTASECGAVGAGPGCFGFTTAERQNTSTTFNIQISAVEVPIAIPEPASIALVTVGLLGMFGVQRRRRVNRA